MYKASQFHMQVLANIRAELARANKGPKWVAKTIESTVPHVKRLLAGRTELYVNEVFAIAIGLGINPSEFFKESHE